MQLTRVYEDERVIIASARNIGLLGWRGTPEVKHMREWSRLGHAIAKSHPGRGLCIDIVVRGTPLFDEDLRRATEELARDEETFELGTVHVVRASGLIGSAVRAFINAILLVARTPQPTKVVGDLRSAVAWAAPKVASAGWTSSELEQLCGELVRALG